MGMPRDELRVDATSHLLEIARTPFGQEQGEKEALEEQIAELVEQLGVIAGKRCVSNLVGLFDGVRHDRPRRLNAVPRALSAKLLGELLELDERLGQAHGVVVVELVVYCAHGSGLGV